MPVPGGGALSGHTEASPPMFGICPNEMKLLMGKSIWKCGMFDCHIWLLDGVCIYYIIYIYVYFMVKGSNWPLVYAYMCIYTHLLVLVSKRVRLFDFWFCRSHTLQIWSHHSFYDFLPESAENIHNKAWDHLSSCGDEVCTCRLSDMEMGQNLYQLPTLTQAHINPSNCISWYSRICPRPSHQLIKQNPWKKTYISKSMVSDFTMSLG